MLSEGRAYHACEPPTVDLRSPRGEWLDADGFSFYGGEFS